MDGSQVEVEIEIPDAAFARGISADLDGPYPIAMELLKLDEFSHLDSATIDFLFRGEPKVKQQRAIIGTAYMPHVNGELSSLFDWMLERLLGHMPDFLIVLDAKYWSQANRRDREILTYHELCHCAQDIDAYGAPKFSRTTGLPVFAIKGHDVEEFDAVVRRYGAHSPDLQQFILAATEHYEGQPHATR